MKYLLFSFTLMLYGISYSQTVGNTNYTGMCQNIGFNNDNENILNNCTNGTLTAPTCLFRVVNNDAHITCGDSRYLYVCGANNWSKSTPNSYKCIN